MPTYSMVLAPYSATDLLDNSAAWTNVNNSKALDGSSAQCNVPGQPTTNTLQWHYLPGVFPAGAVITGFAVDLYRSGSGTPADNSVMLSLGSAPASGTNRADTGTAYPGSITDATHGGPTDQWGYSAGGIQPGGAITGGVYVDFNANFNSSGATVDVDYAQLTIYYTLAGSGGGSGNAPISLGM